MNKKNLGIGIFMILACLWSFGLAFSSGTFKIGTFLGGCMFLFLGIIFLKHVRDE